jgi:hypothetical protein
MGMDSTTRNGLSGCQGRLIFVVSFQIGVLQPCRLKVDALSRSPVDQRSPTDKIAEGPHSASEHVHLMHVMEGSSSSNPDILLSSVSAASAVDPVLISLRHTILQGFLNDK